MMPLTAFGEQSNAGFMGWVESLPSFLIVWKSLCRITIIYSFDLWWHSSVNSYKCRRHFKRLSGIQKITVCVLPGSHLEATSASAFEPFATLQISENQGGKRSLSTEMQVVSGGVQFIAALRTDLFCIVYEIAFMSLPVL